MYDMPGYLKSVYPKPKWIDLVLRSDLDATTKLVACVIAESAQYNRKYGALLTNISDYSISRVIKTNQEEVREKTQLLFDNGWLFDTEARRGARKVYALTFSVIPLGEMRQ